MSDQKDIERHMSATHYIICSLKKNKKERVRKRTIILPLICSKWFYLLNSKKQDRL